MVEQLMLCAAYKNTSPYRAALAALSTAGACAGKGSDRCRTAGAQANSAPPRTALAWA